MGLSRESTGGGAVSKPLVIQKRRPEDRVVALAGNPKLSLQAQIYCGLVPILSAICLSFSPSLYSRMAATVSKHRGLEFFFFSGSLLGFARSSSASTSSPR